MTEMTLILGNALMTKEAGAGAWHAISGLAGAGAGAAAGGEGNRLSGALIGGAVGATGGHFVGKNVDKIVNTAFGAHAIHKYNKLEKTIGNISGKEAYQKGMKKTKKVIGGVNKSKERVFETAGKNINKRQGTIGEFPGFAEMKEGIKGYTGNKKIKKSLGGLDSMRKNVEDSAIKEIETINAAKAAAAKKAAEKTASAREHEKIAISASAIAGALKSRTAVMKGLSKHNMGKFLETNKKTFSQINRMSDKSPIKLREAVALV